MSRARIWLSILACVALVHGAGSGRQALCQVAFDGTANSAVRGPAPFANGNYDIRAELGRIEGRNLFHSFEHFSLRIRESATFGGPDGGHIANVISRVTGGRISNIDGTIRSEIPGADFYFLNPAGVVFGPNAQLDVKGSFHVSTADELRFSDGATFSASNPNGSSFTSAPPEAFGFLDRSAGSITLDQANLAVAPDESVTLSGGDVVIDRGSIFLPELFGSRNGDVTLVAMARPGAVAVADGDTSAAPEGKVRMTGEGGRADGFFGGDGVQVSSFGGGGVVRIRAGSFVVDGAEIHADNKGDQSGGAMIDIVADHVRLTEDADLRSIAFGAGNAGDVTIRAGELEVLSGARVRTATQAAGDAGAVSVGAARRVLVSGEGSGQRTDISSTVLDAPTATGSAGTVAVEAEEITVREFLNSISSNTRGAGDAGSVIVAANRITLLAGGQISSGTLDPSVGKGGNVTVTARQELVISGQSKATEINPRTNKPEPSGIFVSSESVAADTGRAGTATVTAPVITIADHGEISSESLSLENSGQLVVNAADRLVIDAGEISTKAEGEGDGGQISVRAGVLELRNGGLISSAALGDGDAGSVDVQADRLFSERGLISTSTASGGGGSIGLRIGDTIVLRESAITTSVAGGENQTAGNITIDPKVLVIDRSQIQANAPRGFGGNITIVADNVLVPGNDLQALLDRKEISATGEIDDGRVTISAPELDLSGELVAVEGGFVDTTQLRERCASRRDVEASSFTGVGRAGLPQSPDAPLAGAYRGADVALESAQRPASGSEGSTPATLAAASMPGALVLPCAPRS